MKGGWDRKTTCRPPPPGGGRAVGLNPGSLPVLLSGELQILGGPGHAPDALRMNHPGWQCPSEPWRWSPAHPEKEGWVATVPKKLGPPVSWEPHL